MPVTIETLNILSDNTVEVDGLAKNGSYINDATVRLTVKDNSGNALAGATNLTLSYVAASSGKYRGVVPSTVSLDLKGTYWGEITITSSQGNDFRRIESVALYRGKT